MNHRRGTTVSKGLDVFGAVEELHNLSAKEMNKLLRDSQHLFTLRVRTGRGSYIRVNLERLVSHLPLHLIACLASRGPEPRLRYLLRGVRLLHSLSDLALRHPKLEQIFLHEVKIREQVLDLIIYMLITLASPEQEGRLGSSFTILHAALVACSLHLLPAFVAGEWSDLVPVLLMHPKVDIFMDVAFDAVRRDIVLFQTKLRGLNSKLMSNRVSATVAASMAEVIAQQCEASVQVLQSLCQPQAFRDKVLNHKELCKNGGLLRLTLAVLRLQVPVLLAESKYLVSLVNRLKSKILLLMVKFCDTESVSFLDEVAADMVTMQLAEMVAIEVLGLVRNALYKVPLREFREADDDDDDDVPSGLLYIHAMRLADIFSDDSNFRNLVMDYIAPDFAKVLAQSPTVFMSRWCGSSGKDEIKSGSDSVLIYDPFKAAGAAMHSFKSSGGSSTRASGNSNALLPDESSGCSLSAGQLQFSSYSQERSALFVKILANLHCFNPEICPVDEKDRFLNLFVECLTVGPFTPGNSAFFLSTVQTAVRVCENLFMLLDHVSNMSSDVVSDEDLQLVSTFYSSLHDVICPSTSSEDSMQEDPVVAYVKDAHEQKRKNLLDQLQKSERWKRISLFEPGDDKDQNNGGSLLNKSSIQSSVIQQATNECENSNILSEETQVFGDKSVPKRKRGETEEDLKARKKEHNIQPWEIEENPTHDSGFQLFTKTNEVKRENDVNLLTSRDLKISGNNLGVIMSEPIKDANVLPDVRMKDSMQAFKHENITGLGWKYSDLNMCMKSDASNILCNTEEILRANRLNSDMHTNTKESPIDIDRVPNKSTENLGENKLSLESKVVECQKDEFKLQNSSVGLEIDHGATRGIISVHKTSNECSGTSALSEVTANKEMQTNLENKVSLNSENRKEGATVFMGQFMQTNSSKCVTNMNPDSDVEVNSAKFSTGFEMPKGDAGLHTKDSDITVVSNQKEAPTVVAMKCGIYSSGNLSRSHGINTSNGLSSIKEVKQPIEIEVVRIGISERADDTKTVNIKTTGSDCNDKVFSVEFQSEGGSNKIQDERRFSIQQDINLKLKSNVDGLKNQGDGAGTQSQGCQPLLCSVNKEEHKFDFGRLGDQLQVGQHPEYCQNMTQSSLDASHFSMPETFKIRTAETFQISAPTASHVYSSEETGIYLSDGCRASGSDGSRVYPILDANNRFFLGQNEDMQPRKRKRNIMNGEQMALMENALRGEPYMRRHPDLIMQWTQKLNQIGPEISYQQLKNWLNNRKARLLRQRAENVPDGRLHGNETSAPGSSTCSGSSNDPNRSASEDGGNTRDSGSTLQTKNISNMGVAQCKLATEDMDAILDIDMNTVNRSNSAVDMNLSRGSAESDKFGKNVYDTAEVDMTSSSSRRSAPIPAAVKFVRCEAGQFVSLLDKEGREAATGTLCQVEGVWQGKRIDEHGICIVKIVQLNVDKTTRLPHPSPLTGNTFEEAENLCGQMIVAWDTKRIFLIS